MVRLTPFNIIVIASLLFIFAILAWIFFYKKYILIEEEKSPEKSAEDDISITPTGIEAPTFVFFHATWCPHCTSQEMQKTWSELKSILSQNNVLTQEIESKNPEIKKYVIKGYPTLRLYMKGLQNNTLFAEYQGKMNTKDIVEFIKSTLGQQSAPQS